MLYLLLDVLSVLFCLIMVRYFWYRAKFFTHVYQQVGYKHNEYWQWLKDNWEKKVIPADLAFYNIALFVIVVGFGWLDIEITNEAIAIGLLIWGMYWFGSVKAFKPEKVKKPLVITNRVKRFLIPFSLFVVAFPMIFTFWAYTGIIPFLWMSSPVYDPGLLSVDFVMLAFGWVLGGIFIPFFVLAASMLTRPVEKQIQEGFKKQARKKLASMPHLKVVAITGSYGKTSTKFMLRDLLKERYSVCVTPGSFNTPMGICKVINNDLKSHHQILILEMGARYAGNIQELCEIAQPDISIVTIVGVAHLETFGSKEVIAREKGRIVDNLSEGGVAVLNAENPYTAKMGADRADLTRIMAGLEKGDIQAGSILYDTEGSHFNVSVDGEKQQFQTRLLGAHNIHNMLFAIGVAHHLGIRLKTMAIAAKNIEPVEHRLELKKQGDLTIIDDAFNSNPVGAKNAVEILSQFKTGKRIIITPGMIELGEIEYEENKKFGNAIGEANLDLILLVGPERAKPIEEGVREVTPDADNVRVVKSLFEANEIVREIAAPGDVILYENDLPDVYNE